MSLNLALIEQLRDFETRVHLFWRRSDKNAAEKRDFATKLAKEHHNKCKNLKGTKK